MMIDKTHLALIAHCREIIIAHLTQRTGFFHNLDNILFQQSHQAPSEKERKRYFFAMRQLQSHEAELNENLSAKLLEQFDQYWSICVATLPHSMRTPYPPTLLSLISSNHWPLISVSIHRSSCSPISSLNRQCVNPVNSFTKH